MEKVSCKTSDVERLEKDTLLINIKANKNFDKDDYSEIRQASLKLGGGDSFYNIIRLGENTKPNKEAIKAAWSIEGSFYKKADAIVINSPMQRLICQMLIKINPPVVPTRTFNDIEDAKKWIKSLKDSRKKIALDQHLIL